MPVPDLFAEGLARGWKTYNGSRLDDDLELEADVVVVGTGAGGGTTAEILSAAGLKVLLVEEGPLKTSSDFKMQEADAYPELYQEGIGRMSKDGAITILQGRAVGGTTLINWTSSFRTPEPTLQHWAQVYGVKGHSAEDMAPWFEKMEQRLHVAPWALPPNANNDVIRLGCEKLGYHWKVIPRNVSVAGTSATAAWAARSTPSSRCWSPPSRRPRQGWRAALPGARQPAAAGRRQGDGPRMPGHG